LSHGKSPLQLVTVPLGSPLQEGTLHFQSDEILNDYEETITAIGNAVDKYNTTSDYSVWGFGAKFGDETVRHLRTNTNGERGRGDFERLSKCLSQWRYHYERSNGVCESNAGRGRQGQELCMWLELSRIYFAHLPLFLVH